MAKPTGTVCNLDCEYCFFLSKEMLYAGSRFRMTGDLQETHIRQLLAPGLTLAGSSSPSLRAPLGRHARWRGLTEAEEAVGVASSVSPPQGAAISWPISP